MTSAAALFILHQSNAEQQNYSTMEQHQHKYHLLQEQPSEAAPPAASASIAAGQPKGKCVCELVAR